MKQDSTNLKKQYDNVDILIIHCFMQVFCVFCLSLRHTDKNITPQTGT